MKVLLALGVVLACSVALSSPQCSTNKLRYNFETKQKGCMHTGTFYTVGSDWDSECTRCSCEKSGMMCCSMAPAPVEYDKENCEATFHKETCSFTVTKKDNPSETCEVTGMVA